MDYQEIARKRIVKYVFWIYWLLIFEGALRKWFFPQFHEIIFFLRDPIVLLVYITAWRNSFFRQDGLLSTGLLIALLFILLIFLQVLITKINVLTLIYGWRCYFFYLPLTFVIKETFRHEDIHKLIRQTLYISIPLSVLAYVQFISPPSSFINKGFSSFEVFTVAVGIVRTTGTFSFTSGQSMFAASLIAMIAFAWLYRKRYKLLSMPWLLVSTGTSMSILLLSGSRTAFFMAGIIVLCTFVGLMFTNETKLKSNGSFLLVFLILVGVLMSLGPLKKSIDAIGSRFEKAAVSEGNPIFRAIAPLILFTNHVTSAPILGHGLGLTSGGGSRLATGKASWLLAEDDWSRIIVETGPGFGLIFIFYRIYFTFVLAGRCIKAAKQDNNILPMVLLGFIGYYLFAGQIVSVGVFQGYNWIFVGLAMAAAQKQQTGTVQPIFKPLFPNIVGSGHQPIALDNGSTNSRHFTPFNALSPMPKAAKKPGIDTDEALTNKPLEAKEQPVKLTQNRLGQWAKLIAITGSAQVLVQAIGFISGILVIRLLPTHEYALYTLANTMLGTMTLLADGGIASGVMSQGGKVWQDKQKLGAILVTGMELRKKFALFSLVVATPILFYLLVKHDASWLMSGLIILSLIPAFFTSLSGTLLEIAPKLQQDIAPLQKIQVVANAMRLALIGLTLFVYPFAAIAIASAGVSQVWTNWKLRKISIRYADRSQPSDPVVCEEILGVVKRIMPGAIYYCLSGQITIWLISIFGSTEAVAQVGALGRLAMLLNIVSVALNTLIVPRFSRLPNNRKLLITRFLQIESAIIALSAMIISAVWLFPIQTLWVLGKNYSGLTVEVILMAAGSCMTLLYSISYSLCSHRGHIIRPSFNIGLSLGSQILLIYIFGYSSVQDILTYSIANSVIQFIMWTSYFFITVAKKF